MASAPGRGDQRGGIPGPGRRPGRPRGAPCPAASADIADRGVPAAALCHIRGTIPGITSVERCPAARVERFVERRGGNPSATSAVSGKTRGISAASAFSGRGRGYGKEKVLGLTVVTRFSLNRKQGRRVLLIRVRRCHLHVWLVPHWRKRTLVLTSRRALVGVPTESPQVRVCRRWPPQKPHVQDGITRHKTARLLTWPC
jgi:hypothetical protein